MLRSMLILPDLEIPLKSQKVRKKRIYKKSNFEHLVHMIHKTAGTVTWRAKNWYVNIPAWSWEVGSKFRKKTSKFPKGNFILDSARASQRRFPAPVPREGGSPGGSGELFGLPIWRKKSKDKTPGYFFMLRSILILPDLEIPLKSQKIRKTRTYKNRDFQSLTKS